MITLTTKTDYNNGDKNIDPKQDIRQRVFSRLHDNSIVRGRKCFNKILPRRSLNSTFMMTSWKL